MSTMASQIIILSIFNTFILRIVIISGANAFARLDLKTLFQFFLKSSIPQEGCLYVRTSELEPLT